MVDTKELEHIIFETGIKKYKIAQKLGIAAYSLSNKINNKTEFKASEIKAISILLNITSRKQINDIFFVD